MSQPDLIANLREARPVAPAELREHIRRIAAQAPAEPRRSFNWRRALVVVVPVAAAAAAAVALLPHGSQPVAGPNLPVDAAASSAARIQAAPPALSSGAATSVPGSGGALPAPSPARAQRYSASLQLRVADTQAVSDATKQAVRISHALGGYPSSVNVDASGKTGYASIVLRIPKQHVQAAVTRLSALGTIVGESVAIKDLQTQVDSTARRIARLRHTLAGWQALAPSPENQKRIDALTAQIARLVRGRAATIRSASDATVSVQLTTRPAPVVARRGHGPLHGLAVAFHWAWIGAVYFLALGGPIILLAGLGWLLARTVRRRREEALLSRS